MLALDKPWQCLKLFMVAVVRRRSYLWQ